MKYITMLPFMENEDLRELAYQVINEEVKGVKLVVLFPFLDKNTLNEIVDKLIEKGNSKELQRAIPFISKSKVEEIQEAIQNGKLPGFKEEFLLPFLGHEKIKELFKKMVQKANQESDDDTKEDPLVDEDPLDAEDEEDKK